MKRFFFLLLAGFLALQLQASNIPLAERKAPSEAAIQAGENLAASVQAWEEFKVNKDQLSRKERRQTRRALKKDLRKSARDFRDAGDDDLLLLVIITILIPPLGMFLYEGDITNRFWISLLLTLLFYLPGLIYTLIVILGDN